ncbi:hypothetical protein H0H93_011596 [Arthromyces matolae]|nr:hypothetical protein H0H93_011596 [Arthromyces matolae]
MDGNGVTDQTYIVGYWEKTGSVMVAYQGTNVQDLWKSARGPLDIRQVQLDSSLFPHPIGRDENRQKALVHSGAQSHFQVHAKEIMELTGHSFGGALAILAALSLKLNLGSDIKISSRVFASPKIGNQALADYIDNAGLDIVRVNYGKDVIPLLPTGKYRQVSREIVRCSRTGSENTEILIPML